MFSLLLIFTFHVCGAVSMQFFHLICRIASVRGGKSVACFACVAVNLSFLNLACVVASLKFYCLCRCKLVVLYYACVVAKKKKKRKE